MEEEKKVVEQEVVEETKEKQEPAEEKKPEAKEAKKGEKAKKASRGKRFKDAVVRNKKTIIGTVGGFVTGAAGAAGLFTWLGHKQKEKEMQAMAMQSTNIPEETYSPLDPNVD